MKNAGKFFKRQGFYLALLGVVCAAGYLSFKGADKIDDKASQIKLAREGNRVNDDKKSISNDETKEDESKVKDDAIDTNNIKDENKAGIQQGAQVAEDINDVFKPDITDIIEDSKGQDDADAPKKINADETDKDNGDKISKTGHDLGVVNVSAVAYSFDQEKGVEWPLEGNIIMKFSDEAPVYYETVGSFMVNDGLVIAAHMGDEVKCGCDGVVTNIYEDDMYGNMIDISIGDDYTLTYGQLENVKVNIGDDVKASDVIANVAAPSSFFAKEGENVFVRIRDEEGYIDPLFFLK